MLKMVRKSQTNIKELKEWSDKVRNIQDVVGRSEQIPGNLSNGQWKSVISRKRQKKDREFIKLS